MTTTDIDNLKYFSDSDVPRTQEEKELIIRDNELFRAVAARVEGLTVEEFKRSSRCWISLEPGDRVRKDQRTVAETEAEAVYVAAIAEHVAASRRGDADMAKKAAVRAGDARGVLWGLRDRTNELIFPWADPDDDRRDKLGEPVNLY